MIEVKIVNSYGERETLKFGTFPEADTFIKSVQVRYGELESVYVESVRGEKLPDEPVTTLSKFISNFLDEMYA